VPDPRKRIDRQGTIQSILRRIPGFGGYLRREDRRASDDLARQWLADRLQRGKRGLDDYGRVLVDAAQIGQLAQLDRVRSRLDRLTGRIRGAPGGYSGFFDLVQVDEDLLDDVYDHDVKMIDAVDELARMMEDSHQSADDAALNVSSWLEKVDALEKQLDQREDLLKGLAEDA
jgi:hypothetical protein